MCALLVASASKSNESCDSKPKGYIVVWNRGIDDLNDLCESFGTFDLGTSGKPEPKSPATVLVAKENPGKSGLCNTCNIGLQTLYLDSAASWSLMNCSRMFLNLRNCTEALHENTAQKHCTKILARKHCTK